MLCSTLTKSNEDIVYWHSAQSLFILNVHHLVQEIFLLHSSKPTCHYYDIYKYINTDKNTESNIRELHKDDETTYCRNI